MLPQSGLPIEPRRVQQIFDLLQGQAHFPAEQDLLKAVYLLRPVEAVVVVPAPPGAEQSDGVVVAQGSGGQAREAGQLFYGIHPFLHLLEPRINHDAASRSSVFFRLR